MRLIKNVKIFLIAFFAVLFEMVAGKYIAFSGISPMITLCLCLAMALLEEKFAYVAAVPAILGAVLDILCGHGFGTYTITFELASVLTFFVKDKIFSSKIILLIPDVLFMTVMAECLYYAFHINAVNSTGFFTALVSIILPTGVYNIIVCLIFYPVLKALLYRRR